ncbi:outer-membrane lipoprotein carrier protein LolA [Bartonella sp. TP]|uniref:outer-membrane lipoprotein carrier protein LolA n=1 Tax=Bartonella sp. TP TaxID=3057550 RepID=UPI0025B1DA20|nr:outer-membrane lipoprotein carrier protein LolA [Bartonella sp. TP]MDN5248553.1 outer-membrane lipoprotein carrier protein LolA [Alphaproteobacteria bacterium]WJW79525.1 outer-membrane lipoprotein carrier protein LolA [Bartonella sp. TP]
MFKIIKKSAIFASLIWLALFSQKAYAASAEATAQNILDNFAATATQMSDFIQIGPHGERTHGTFYLERPGKIRFFYKDAPLNIIADGTSVAINNTRLDSWDLYNLSQTPMKMLLANSIDLRQGQLAGVTRNGNLVTIILRDRQLGNGSLRLSFGARDHELQQWTLIDAQNLPTTVKILNRQKNVGFEKDMFAIPYQDIAMKR